MLFYLGYTYVSNVSKVPVYACYFGTIKPADPLETPTVVFDSEIRKIAYFSPVCKRINETGCPPTHYIGGLNKEVVMSIKE